MAVSAPPRPPAGGLDPEAIIAEARRRQQRRRLGIAAVLLFAAAMGAAAFLLARGGGRHAGWWQPGIAAPGRPAPNLRLERPGALAVGGDGTVYIADDAHGEILALRNGRLRLVARGFGTGGMAVAPDGTLYVADAGHNLVRAIAPDGSIRTVAGDGRAGWVTSGTPALAAHVGSPDAVTFDPQERLVIGADAWGEVLRLERDGTLTRLTGDPGHGGIVGFGRRATTLPTGGATALAYGTDGSLYVAGFATKTVARITPQGWLARVGLDYSYAGAMAATPDGRVLTANRTSVLELTPRGSHLFLDFQHRRIAGVPGLDVMGIAAGSDGTLYLDTWPSGYSNENTTSVVALRPDGSARLLWPSR